MSEMRSESRGSALESPEKSPTEELMKTVERLRQVKKIELRIKGLTAMDDARTEAEEDELYRLQEELEEMPSLEGFFDTADKVMPALQLEHGGNYHHDAIIALPDGSFLMREVTSEYDVDKTEYRFIERVEALQALQESVSADEKRIRERMARREKVLALVEKIKATK
ncbi:MAG: hypothetical protein WCJ29_04585 [bacterium]